MGARIASLPVSRRRRAAFRFSSTGPYVSGTARNSGHVAPAKISPIQYVQRHETTDTKPSGAPRMAVGSGA